MVGRLLIRGVKTTAPATGPGSVSNSRQNTSSAAGRRKQLGSLRRTLSYFWPIIV